MKSSMWTLVSPRGCSKVFGVLGVRFHSSSGSSGNFCLVPMTSEQHQSSSVGLTHSNSCQLRSTLLTATNCCVVTSPRPFEIPHSVCPLTIIVYLCACISSEYVSRSRSAMMMLKNGGGALHFLIISSFHFYPCDGG